MILTGPGKQFRSPSNTAVGKEVRPHQTEKSDSHRAVAYMSLGVSASFHLAPVPIKMPPWQWIK